MSRRRRITLALLLALALALMLAPAALAAAGGGSAGFGGGGGGGGGGHGSGFALYLIFQLLFRIALIGHGLGALFLLAMFLLYLFFTRVAPQARSSWAARGGASLTATRKRVAQRERKVELAAAEAAEDDPAFAPDHVRASATKLYTDIQAAWDADDRFRLRGLVAPAMLAEWELRLDDFERRGWRNRVAPLEPPQVEYVGLTHRGNDREDRVVVRIEAKLRDYVEDRAGNRIKRAGRMTETIRTREFWTLGKRDGHWILLSIEQASEGVHALKEDVVASPWSDDVKMRDEALVEGAVADAIPEGTRIAEVADLDFQGDARAAALDLSLADARFAPDVMEVAARRAVAAWTEAVDGDDAKLLAIASPESAQQMLHPGDPSQRTRLVVRGPQIKRIRIVGLDAGSEPPTMTIEVDLTGRRYLEERGTTAVVSGSQSRQVSFTEHWTLALAQDPAQPWRISAVRTPVAPREPRATPRAAEPPHKKISSWLRDPDQGQHSHGPLPVRDGGADPGQRDRVPAGDPAWRLADQRAGHAGGGQVRGDPLRDHPPRDALRNQR
jgi:predicted lipid-binding transport protein (Tim44 family)